MMALCMCCQVIFVRFFFHLKFFCVSSFPTMYALEVLYAQIMCKDWEAWSMSLGNLYKLSETLIKGIWFSHVFHY